MAPAGTRGKTTRKANKYRRSKCTKKLLVKPNTQTTSLMLKDLPSNSSISKTNGFDHIEGVNDTCTTRPCSTPKAQRFRIPESPCSTPKAQRFRIPESTCSTPKAQRFRIPETDTCSTPKAQRFRIPQTDTCPPPPKKQRSLPSVCSLRTTPITFFSSPDLELFFFFAYKNIPAV